MSAWAALRRAVAVPVVAAFAWLVSTGWFLFRPRQVAVSVRLYRALFPGRGRLHAVWLAWRQYHRFAGRYAERLRWRLGGRCDVRLQGADPLREAVAEGRGGVLVMSHLGDNEAAARGFHTLGLRQLIYTGGRALDEQERMTASEGGRAGLTFVAAGNEDAAGFQAVEALRFVREGGFVTLPGDQVWTTGARHVTARFLDHDVRLPAAPFALALLARAPLYVFFARRDGRRRYRLDISPPLHLPHARGAARQAALEAAAQTYADHLAAALRDDPADWGTFTPLLDEPPARERRRKT